MHFKCTHPNALEVQMQKVTFQVVFELDLLLAYGIAARILAPRVLLRVRLGKFGGGKRKSSIA